MTSSVAMDVNATTGISIPMKGFSEIPMGTGGGPAEILGIKQFCLNVQMCSPELFMVQPDLGMKAVSMYSQHISRLLDYTCVRLFDEQFELCNASAL